MASFTTHYKESFDNGNAILKWTEDRSEYRPATYWEPDSGGDLNVCIHSAIILEKQEPDDGRSHAEFMADWFEWLESEIYYQFYRNDKDPEIFYNTMSAINAQSAVKEAQKV